VVPARNFDAERALHQLSAYARSGSGLPSLKRPKRYVAVDRIPTSAVGKILRRELTEGRYEPLAEALPSELKGRGAAWTEERGTSDEGPPPQAARPARRRLRAPRKRTGDT